MLYEPSHGYTGTLTRYVRVVADIARVWTAEELQDVAYLAVVGDGWQSRIGREYQVVSGQGLDSTWNTKKFMLGLHDINRTVFLVSIDIQLF